MSTINNPIPDFSGLTFEKVWAMFQETDKKIQATQSEIDKLAKLSKETDAKIDKLSQETSAKIDKLSQETSANMDKLSQETNAKIDKLTEKTHTEMAKLIKTVNKVTGNLGGRLGDVIEHLVAPGIKTKFKEFGLEFTQDPIMNVEIFDPISHKAILEFDIVLENESSIVVVEIKTKPSMTDIRAFIKRLQRFRTIQDQEPDKKNQVIYGALAGAVFPRHIIDAALSAGFFVIAQSGDTMKFKNSKDFKAKEF
jgi:uncharacterized protein (DUF885 family)